MDKFFSLLIPGLILSLTLTAQTPETFSYQAVARDGNGSLLGNRSLTVRIGILQDGSLIWQEDHPVSTNSMGLFQVRIGDPEARNKTGPAGSFQEIPWSAGNLELHISIDDGNGFTDLGTAEFQSVPYALYAAEGPGGDPGSDDQQLGLSGSILSITNGNSVDLSPILGSDGLWSPQEDTIATFKHVGIGTSSPNRTALAVQGLNVHPETPLFEVRREDGFPVFAVYNDGVMVYVDEEAKGVKGGFAVGGYRRSAKGLTQEYLRVSPDSVRIYVPDSDQAKGVKGGFAVGGYRRAAKGVARDLFFVHSDSTRVYVPNKGNDAGFVGLQGGFAVSGYTDGSKGASTDYLMGINRGITRFNTSDRDRGFAIGSQGDGWGTGYLELTPTNSFIGSDAGLNNMEVDTVDEFGWGLGTMNVFLGYQAGMENVAGHHNTFLGFCAGTKTVGDLSDQLAGSHNVFLGSQAGFKNTIGFKNIYIGYHAGINTLQGEGNIFIGNEAGYNSSGAYSSILIGEMAGASYSGGYATYLGNYAGYNSTGPGNTYIGADAGAYSGAGENNTALGRYAGQNGTGSGNVLIGRNAGRGSFGNSTYYDNVAIGHESGQALTDGYYNTIIGPYAGQSSTSARGNVFIGYNSGHSYVDGWSNTFVGGNSGYSTVNGVMNTYLGNKAGYSNETGDRNTGLGHSTGYSNASGSGNIFIGYHAGYNETGSDKLYIHNNDTDYPIIYGQFDNGYLEFNADVYVFGTVNEVSDSRVKSDVRTLTNALDNLKRIRGVSYRGVEDDGRKGPGNTNRLGVIAQEVETVYPALVSEDARGVKAVNYSGLIPVLLEAVKEQQAQIDALEQKVAELER